MIDNLKLKEKAARLVQIPLLQRFMVFGIQLLVPRQRVGVSLVAFDRDERVFLLRHVFHPFAPWGLPGGWLKRHESPADGVLRELREETGLTAVLGPVVHIDQEPSPSHIGIAFTGWLQAGSIRLSPEIIEAAWFYQHDLPMPLLPFVRESIKKAGPIAQAAKSPETLAIHVQGNLEKKL